MNLSQQVIHLQSELEKKKEIQGRLSSREQAQYELCVYLNGANTEPFPVAPILNYVSVEMELPKVPKDRTVVTVEVRTKNGFGEATFGYHGGPGEGPDGTFFLNISHYDGDLMGDREVPLMWAWPDNIDPNKE